MHDALLAALDENPDDLTTWDVLADWLEERGDPRAEFMRLTRDTGFPNPALPAEQQARLREAQARAETAWFGQPLDRWAVVWRHGFVARVLCAFGPTWRAHRWGSGQPLQGHAALRFVRELNVARLADLAPAPLRHLQTLRCSGLNAEGLDRVQLPRLKLAVLMQGSARWPARLPPPDRLYTPGLVNLDVRANYSALREWASPVPVSAAWDFRERPPPVLPRRHAAIAKCVTCGTSEVRAIAHGTSRGQDNGGDFWTFHDEAWCPQCGTFTEREHDV